MCIFKKYMQTPLIYIPLFGTLSTLKASLLITGLWGSTLLILPYSEFYKKLYFMVIKSTQAVKNTHGTVIEMNKKGLKLAKLLYRFCHCKIDGD